MRAASQHMLVSEVNYESFGKAIVDAERAD